MDKKTLRKLFSRPSQALMPAQFLDSTIASMRNGETGWAVPWGMWIDCDGKCWLNDKYNIHEKQDAPERTAQMKIMKVNGMYIVDISACSRHGWSITDSHDHPWQGDSVPVAELKV